MVTAHEPVPEQPEPLQPLNVVLVVFETLSVTVVPNGKLAVQVFCGLLQLIPGGVLVTVASPVPVSVTVKTGLLKA